jgi:hypothetical protein
MSANLNPLTKKNFKLLMHVLLMHDFSAISRKACNPLIPSGNP